MAAISSVLSVRLMAKAILETILRSDEWPNGLDGIMKVFLDDLRPAPDGWTLARDIETVKPWLSAHAVEELSLDNDLGCCASCLPSQALLLNPSCSHVGTGEDLVRWMAETGFWPDRVRIHSRNYAAAERMKAVMLQYARSTDADI